MEGTWGIEALKWWIQVTGVFYLLLFAAGAIIQAPVELTLEQAGIAPDLTNYAHRLLVNVWVMFSLELGVIGAALLYAAGAPHKNRILVWTVLGLELVRGIVDDAFMLTRGYKPAVYLAWIGIHLLIIGSGLWALHRSPGAAPAPAADVDFLV